MATASTVAFLFMFIARLTNTTLSDMTRKIAVCVLFLLCWIPLAKAQKPTATPTNNPPSDRYQLIPVKVEIQNGNGEVNTLFLLDTKTGKVWRYQPFFMGKNKTTNEQRIDDEVFIPIGFAEYVPKGKASPGQ